MRCFAALLALVLSLVAAAPNASAAVTYTYTGIHFSYVGTGPDVTKVSGSFTVSSVLPANTTTILASGSSSSSMLISYSFTDGRTTWTLSNFVANTANAFSVTTNASGNIVSWDVNLWNSVGFITTCTSCNNGGAYDDTSVSYNYDAYNFGSPGSWSENLNGSGDAVIAPVYDGSTSAESFIRLFNGGSATSTFSITIVDASDGDALGSVSIQVPKNASPQYPLTSAGGSNSIFAQGNVTDSSGTSYALYIQDTDTAAGYQHVTYNGTTALFENNSICSTPIDLQLTSSNTEVLTNVHTSALAGGAYPSVISIDNYANTSTSVTITVVDAATGNSIGTLSETVAANEMVTLPESQIETQLGFHPTSAQLHINLFFANAAGGSLPVEVGHSIHNAQLGGDINMSLACAVKP